MITTLKRSVNPNSYIGKLVRIWISLFVSLMFGYLITGGKYLLNFEIPKVSITSSLFMAVILLLQFTFGAALIISHVKVKLPTMSAVWRIMIAIYIPLILCFLLVLDYGYEGLIRQFIYTYSTSIFVEENIYFLITLLQITTGLIFLTPWKDRRSLFTGAIYAAVLYQLLYVLQHFMWKIISTYWI